MNLTHAKQLLAFGLTGLAISPQADLRAGQKATDGTSETSTISATTNPVGIVAFKKGSGSEIAKALSAERTNSNYGFVFHSIHIDLAAPEHQKKDSFSLMLTAIPGKEAIDAIAKLSPSDKKLLYSETTGNGIYLVKSAERTAVQKALAEMLAVSGGEVAVTIRGGEAFTIFILTPTTLPKS